MIRQALFTQAALLATLAAATVPTTASAANVSIKGKCYVAYPDSSEQSSFGEPIPVEIEDLQPGRQVRLTLEVKGVMTSASPMLTATKSGNLSTALDTWVTGMGVGPTKGAEARMVVRDFWLGTELGSASLKVANVAALVDGDLLDIRVKRRWYVSGLSEISKRNTYYAHYFVGGKHKAKMYLGKTQDRCGFLRVNKVTYPGSPSKVPAKFEIRVQASSKFNDDEPFVAYQFVRVGSETPMPPSDPVL